MSDETKTGAVLEWDSGLSNYYGELIMRREADGSFYLSLADWDGDLWEDITDEQAQGFLAMTQQTLEDGREINDPS